MFLKADIDTQKFQLSNGFQQCNRVAGETRDGFRYYEIQFPGTAVIQHPLKILSVVLGTRQRLVGIDTAILPARMLLNKAAVIADLCGKGMEHGILAGGNSGVGCDSCELRCFRGEIDLLYYAVQ